MQYWYYDYIITIRDIVLILLSIIQCNINIINTMTVMIYDIIMIPVLILMTCYVVMQIDIIKYIILLIILMTINVLLLLLIWYYCNDELMYYNV